MKILKTILKGLPVTIMATSLLIGIPCLIFLYTKSSIVVFAVIVILIASYIEGEERS